MMLFLISCNKVQEFSWAIFLIVFQHYPLSPVALVTDNLEGTFFHF